MVPDASVGLYVNRWWSMGAKTLTKLEGELIESDSLCVEKNPSVALDGNDQCIFSICSAHGSCVGSMWKRNGASVMERLRSRTQEQHE